MTAPVQIGSYRIERLLGVGSFATVWLGHDASLGSRVAIKVLAENWSHDLRVRERFMEEARLLWRLDHERLVRVYAVGELVDGRPYSVMAWADGGSLRDRLDVAPLPVATALRLLGEIAAAAAVLHDHGIVHRDLTPGNILFRSNRPATGGPTEQVLVADLGLAKALAAASGLTARAGTPGYMAPEQDNPLAVVDARADVFGLGRLGMRLLAAEDPARPDRPVRLRVGVPPRVAAVLRRATARQPADRYPDARAFGVALAQASGQAVDVPPAVKPKRARRHRRAVRAGALLLAVVAVAATAADSVPGRPPGIARTGTDGGGRIAVSLPAGWRAIGTGWAGQRGADGELEPAVVISPDPARWWTDPAVPGAFLGLSRGTAARTTAAGFVAERPHATCTAAPARRTRQGGVDWVVVSFACASGKSVIVEAAGLAAGDTAMVYAQIAPPAGAGRDFVDALLAGVRAG